MKTVYINLADPMNSIDLTGLPVLGNDRETVRFCEPFWFKDKNIEKVVIENSSLANFRSIISEIRNKRTVNGNSIGEWINIAFE